MKKYIIFSALCSFVLLSCGNQQEDIKIEIPEVSATTDGKSCYEYAKGNDTIHLQISIVGNKVNGDLVYDWFEKDRNSGSVSGFVKGDTVIVDYTFMSEGMESIREEVFLKKGNDYWIGYGDAEEKGNKWVYKNYKQLKFDDIQLKSIVCK